MWKRLNTRPSQQPAPPPPAPRIAIGNPTLIESTLDEESASKLTDLPSAGSSGAPADHYFGRSSPLQQQQQQQLQQQPKPHSTNAVVVSSRDKLGRLDAEGSTDATAHGQGHGSSSNSTAHAAPLSTLRAAQPAPPRAQRPPQPQPRPRPRPPPTTQLRPSTPPGRPTSSVYSQPSPDAATMLRGEQKPLPVPHAQPTRLQIPRSSSIYPDDISPPDSPHTGDGARSSSPNVSPITDGGSSGHRVYAARAHALNATPPMPPNASSAASISSWKEKIAAAKARTQDGGKAKTMWDDYSGEPTGSEKGKTGQVAPGSTQFDKHGNAIPTPASRIPEPAKPSTFGVTLTKVNKVLNKEVQLPRAPWQPKEPWKGGSAREPIQPPVKDAPRPSGAKLPTPSERRQKQGLRQMVNMRAGGNSGKSSPTPAPPPGNQKENRPPRTSSRTPEPSLSADPPGRQSPPRAVSVGRYDTPTPTQGHSPPSREPHDPSMAVAPLRTNGIRKGSLPPTPTEQTAAPRYAMNSNTAADYLTSSPQVSTPVHEKLQNAVRGLALDNTTLPPEPSVSRFSWTTYATTAPGSGSNTPNHRRSLSADRPPVPPLPSSPLLMSSAASASSPPLTAQPPHSILDRKRPVPSSRAAFAPSRKPTPSDLAGAAAATAGGASPSSSGVATPTNGLLAQKGLPQQPAAEAAVDRVTLLEAKIASLTRRKANLATVIAELDTVAHPTSAAYDAASRSEVQRTVASLEAESAAVAKEIHETGLVLHRVLRKRGDGAEPTGLWVRRVTE